MEIINFHPSGNSLLQLLGDLTFLVLHCGKKVAQSSGCPALCIIRNKKGIRQCAELQICVGVIVVFGHLHKVSIYYSWMIETLRSLNTV